jgi:hypothetical protein
MSSIKKLSDFWRRFDATTSASAEAALSHQASGAGNTAVEHSADDPAGVGQNSWSWMENTSISAGTGNGPVIESRRY